MRNKAAADAHGFVVADTALLTAEPIEKFFDDLRGRSLRPPLVGNGRPSGR
jgi:hypothetical protein